ncbi:MAG: lipid-binding SYLF domain-containing protein [Alphaproteobacteria bacterium]|nr:lipid-binding SYLF domain-containing protein [Alphaproteobacteria bacterium]
MKISHLVSGAALALALTASTAFASDQTELVAHATRVAEHMKSDPAFAAASDMLHRARAVLIVPSLVKGGFIFGAEGGNGVLLKHNGRGWSSPAFYSMGSGSFGLQIGLEKAEIVMLIMSDRALAGIQHDEFKIGAGGGITAVTLSSGAEGATSGHGGDIVVWTSATGAYGGLTFNGSIIKPRHEWNSEYYGQRASVGAILSSSVKNPDSRGLQGELASIR